jgi:NADH dehydrogenase (ubiquinone) 1 alpha subcomplex subunit 2
MLTAAPRNFLLRSYPTMKKHNPHTPIMIREASGTEPTVYARFGACNTRAGQSRC